VSGVAVPLLKPSVQQTEAFVKEKWRDSLGAGHRCRGRLSQNSYLTESSLRRDSGERTAAR
jgi:hypothetical protein